MSNESELEEETLNIRGGLPHNPANETFSLHWHYTEAKPRRDQPITRAWASRKSISTWAPHITQGRLSGQYYAYIGDGRINRVTFPEQEQRIWLGIRQNQQPAADKIASAQLNIPRESAANVRALSAALSQIDNLRRGLAHLDMAPVRVLKIRITTISTMLGATPRPGGSGYFSVRRSPPVSKLNPIINVAVTAAAAGARVVNSLFHAAEHSVLGAARTRHSEEGNSTTKWTWRGGSADRYATLNRRPVDMFLLILLIHTPKLPTAKFARF
ncbi:hypothetical protein DFH09DRAFT_1279611, partial [Mycena vulgaris]